MIKRAVFLVFLLFYSLCQAKNIPFEGHIGQIKSIHEIRPDVDNIVGIAFKDSKEDKSLYIFEGTSGKLHKYSVDNKSGNPVCTGSLLIEGAELENPRGLTYAREDSGDVFYFLDYVINNAGQKGLLYRYDAINNVLTFVDLSLDAFEIGSSEVYGVTKQGGTLFISFDPNNFEDRTTCIRRGILKISIDEGQSFVSSYKGKEIQQPYGWAKALSGTPIINGHIPGPGKEVRPVDAHPYDSFTDLRIEPSRALAGMEAGGMEYLWGTVGDEYIYVMEARTGRGLFYFDKPKSSAQPFYDMIAFGDNDLWVADKIDDAYFIYRINVLENPNLPSVGQKRFRELKMQITSNLADNGETPDGLVYHTFCHPYDSAVVLNQGVVANSISVNDKTGVTDYKIEQLYFDPAGDSSVRQHYTLVTYPADKHPGIRKYITEFYVKLWKRDLRYFIYPHLVKKSSIANTRYLEDDTILYNIKSNTDAYNDFVDRVKDYVADEYGITPNMQNPYWASRNIIEYVMEHYHYPIDSGKYWATYDYAKGHYNSHPGDLKAELSANGTYEDNIIACSGTGCMINGLFRFIGIPGLWVGTSNEAYPEDGFLEAGSEGARQINGHRYNHVWMGDLYGWQRFDATPMRPVNAKAYYQKPLEVSQWTLMVRGPGSTTQSKRVIHNLQSEHWEKMHVPFRGDCMHLVNNCGAVRYNLLGSYTYPELFYYSNHYLRSRAIQFIENVNVAIGKKSRATVTWEKSGEWELDPEARLMLVLKEKRLPDDETVKSDVLATDIPLSQEKITVDLSNYNEGEYRLVVAKVGDPAIGNQATFKLEQK